LQETSCPLIRDMRAGLSFTMPLIKTQNRRCTRTFNVTLKAPEAGDAIKRSRCEHPPCPPDADHRCREPTARQARQNSCINRHAITNTSDTSAPPHRRKLRQCTSSSIVGHGLQSIWRPSTRAHNRRTPHKATRNSQWNFCKVRPLIGQKQPF